MASGGKTTWGMGAKAARSAGEASVRLPAARMPLRTSPRRVSPATG